MCAKRPSFSSLGTIWRQALQQIEDEGFDGFEVTMYYLPAPRSELGELLIAELRNAGIDRSPTSSSGVSQGLAPDSFGASRGSASRAEMMRMIASPY